MTNDIMTPDEVNNLTFIYRDFERLVGSHRAQAKRIKERSDGAKEVEELTSLLVIKLELEDVGRDRSPGFIEDLARFIALYLDCKGYGKIK